MLCARQPKNDKIAGRPVPFFFHQGYDSMHIFAAVPIPSEQSKWLGAAVKPKQVIGSYRISVIAAMGLI